MQMLQVAIYTNDSVFNMSMNCIKNNLSILPTVSKAQIGKINKHIIDIKCKQSQNITIISMGINFLGTLIHYQIENIICRNIRCFLTRPI